MSDSPSDPDREHIGEEGSQQATPDIRTGFIRGDTFTRKAVQYEAVNGRAMFEGDICLGTVDEMERTTMRASSEDDAIVSGVGISGTQFRWPDALMPYEVDSSLPNPGRVADAVEHWEDRTHLRFVQRTSANASQYPNYVRVVDDGGCWSYVGMRGGEQLLSLGSGCGVGSAIHEFGHAWGHWHEQSREDRDTYVRILWQNIEAGREHNFNQHISDGDDIGSYDYGSIMHYGRKAFGIGNRVTIEQLRSGPTIGQRNGLSAGDIAAAHAMYTERHTNVAVSMVFATPHSKNAWAHLAGAGWRKIDGTSTDGVSNTFAVLALARANDRRVRADTIGRTLLVAYGL
ncbi:MAG TPA: M12 family metallopeptidase [Ornithinimicrobium sp.]|uniref:M12 family metallopeptidase n=1 Tax=Ornithinimicrobium sp. TaxID=1977084 RepID=UPI002B47660C|nr:M12 family metallopeptidase [Ornithinimicrobium sp.]HKJ12339.1 M12 family metallopeptidase [Ornithinimicrobium sp.]